MLGKIDRQNAIARQVAMQAVKGNFNGLGDEDEDVGVTIGDTTINYPTGKAKIPPALLALGSAGLGAAIVAWALGGLPGYEEITPAATADTDTQYEFTLGFPDSNQ